MNRQQRRALQKQQHAYVADLPAALTLIPHGDLPQAAIAPAKAWRSRKYLVQLFNEPNGVIRLSICRVKLGIDGRWEDGLTWDELQAIKREIGYGDWYAVEVYPRDRDVISVANFRHLWLLPIPLEIGWFKT